MEVLIFIATIIFIIAKNAAKVKQQSQQNEPQKPETVNQPRNPMTRAQFEELQRKITGEFFGEKQKEQGRDYQGVNRPKAEGYREERPLTKNSIKYESEEGRESNEGKCIEPNANHCAVEHFDDTVYASEIGTENSDFTREDLVKGIIMAEIISKPKSMQ